MSPVSRVTFFRGVEKLEKMLNAATEEHTPVIAGYVRRLVAVAPVEELEILEGMVPRFSRLRLYPVFGIDHDKLTVVLITPPA